MRRKIFTRTKNMSKNILEPKKEVDKFLVHTKINLNNTLHEASITDKGILIPLVTPFFSGDGHKNKEVVYYLLKKDLLIQAFESWGYSLDKIKDGIEPYSSLLDPKIKINFLGSFDKFPTTAIAGDAIVHNELTYIYDGESWRNLYEFLRYWK